MKSKPINQMTQADVAEAIRDGSLPSIVQLAIDKKLAAGLQRTINKVTLAMAEVVNVSPAIPKDE